MGIGVGIAAALLAYYLGDRAAHLWRKARIEQRRSKATYPLTDYNDPLGRTIV